jgi:hypothetical protein
MQTSTIRPGLLVSLNTTVRGNVSYSKIDIERDHTTDAGERKAKWETERTIADPAEFEQATKIRSKARSLIASICTASAFGMLCPQADADKLAALVDEARKLADDFNATASLTRVSVYVIAGKIAADDMEATKAINSEVRELLDRMERGVRNLDVDTIREAANKAKAIGNMITPDANARLQLAIETARKAARAISKAGEQAAAEVDYRAIRAITEGRTAFLDLDEAQEIAAPIQAGRSIDMDAADVETSSAGPERRALDLDDAKPTNAAPAQRPQLDLI